MGVEQLGGGVRGREIGRVDLGHRVLDEVVPWRQQLGVVLPEVADGLGGGGGRVQEEERQRHAKRLACEGTSP